MKAQCASFSGSGFGTSLAFTSVVIFAAAFSGCATRRAAQVVTQPAELRGTCRSLGELHATDGRVCTSCPTPYSGSRERAIRRLAHKAGRRGANFVVWTRYQERISTHSWGSEVIVYGTAYSCW
jgi:Putative heavy-metal-binding